MMSDDSEKLRAFLLDKRYFITVDDIWSVQAWEVVKSALPENNLNSRIITTTRIINVAESCCSSLAGYIYKIQPLCEKQSQHLFFKRVFGDTSACPPHLEEISHGILEKCHGLPLAIITIASMLVRKSNKVQWEQVYNSINSAFSHKGMRDILLLSYYDLPYHLKTCLLYLSMYPEDFLIEKEELIWRWIAEEFIGEVRGQTMYQVAENYFNELVNRSLIQPISILYDGRGETCRVHDMVLELIVSLSDEENFASIVEGQSYNGGVHKIRRLSVQFEQVGDEMMQRIVEKWSQVRAIGFYGLHEPGICPHLQELNSLRVLVFYYGNYLGNQFIKYIGSFFQLTYLSIHSGGITELPESIGDLRYLQTLDIRGSNIRKLPVSIGHLQKLVRLLVDEYVELPNEIGDLQALQELSPTRNFSIKFVESLSRLIRLRTLGIYVPDGGYDTGDYKEALKSCLAAMGKHGLQSLHICNGGILKEELMDILCCTVPCIRKLLQYGSSITRLPKQLASLINLTHLLLTFERIKQEDLCILGALPALLFSWLHVAHAPDERLTVTSQQFRCLKEFRFWNEFFGYGGGLEMLFLQGAMPELRRLHIFLRAKETESKMGFMFSFEHLACLEHISTTIVHSGATRSRVEAAEAAIKNAVSIHPGHPTLDMDFIGSTLEDMEDRQRERGQVGMRKE